MGEMLRNYLHTRLVKTRVTTGREKQNDGHSHSEEPGETYSPDTYGRTVLHRACWDGDEEKVQDLVTDARSETLNAKDQWGRTPLWCAVTQGQLGVVTIMVECEHIKLETKDSYGKSLEFRANEKGYTEIEDLIKQEKIRRQLTVFAVNDDSNSEQALREKLESTENQLCDLEKRHAIEKMNLEVSCSEAVERLLKENEDKLKKVEERQKTEIEILNKQKETIEQKMSINTSNTDSSAPAYPPGQQEPYNQYLPPCPECPICMENLMPPRRIFQCGNGHLICEICQPKMKEKKCPTCLQVFVGRAIAMEQHLRTLFMN